MSFLLQGGSYRNSAGVCGEVELGVEGGRLRWSVLLLCCLVATFHVVLDVFLVSTYIR